MTELCGTDLLEPPRILKPGRRQRAVFVKNLLWDVGSTIKIYFFPSTHIQVVTPSKFQEIKTLLVNDKTLSDSVLVNYIYWLDSYDSSKDDLYDPLYREIQGKVTPEELVRKVVTKRIAPLVNLKFEFTNNLYDSNIRIRFDSTKPSSNSYIGNPRQVSKTTHTMLLSVLDIADVLHEFGHVLGMGHEHQNPNNNPIEWNVDNLSCFYKESKERIQTRIVDRYNRDQINASEYDPKSIMLYSFPDTVQCNNITLRVTKNGISLPKNYKLSNLDTQWLQRTYPFKVYSPYSFESKIDVRIIILLIISGIIILLLPRYYKRILLMITVCLVTLVFYLSQNGVIRMYY